MYMCMSAIIADLWTGQDLSVASDAVSRTALRYQQLALEVVVSWFSLLWMG